MSTAWLWLVSPALFLALAGLGEDASYQKEIESWREERETNLKKDGSWLTVAGLYWLREGESTVGADPANDFVLPEGSAPPFVGVFGYESGKVTFRANDGVSVVQNEKPVTSVGLEPGEKNALRLGKLSMWVHASGPRLAIRLRDLDSPIRKDFTGLEWFPIAPAYRVTAKFTPHAKPKDVEILNMLGDIERYQSPGVVDFELLGETRSHGAGLEHRTRPPLVHLQGCDERQGNLSLGAFSLRRRSQGRDGRRRFQHGV